MKQHITLFFALAIGVVLFNGKSSAQPTTTDSTFKPHGVVSALFFVDYFYKINGDSSAGSKGYYATTPKDFQAFDIRRVYLGYDYFFSPNISASVLLAHEPAVAPGSPAATGATAGGLLGDGTNGFYLKGANVKIKGAIPMATIIVGQQPTPAFQLSEMIWSYRSIEKTLLDFRGLEGSNDIGVAVKGNFDNEGNFGYTAMISNGANQKNEFNKFKKYFGELFAMFLDKKIVVELVADENYTGAGSNDTNKAATLKGFVALQLDPITIGVEYAGQNQTTEGKPNVTPGGLSVFARGPIMEKTLGFFARFDTWNPDQNTTDKGFNENFITAGLDWQPVSNVHIEPNVWIDSYKDKSSANTDRKADVAGRLTFYSKF